MRLSLLCGLSHKAKSHKKNICLFEYCGRGKKSCQLTLFNHLGNLTSNVFGFAW